MTTKTHSNPTPVAKVVAFLKGGGIAKAGKVVQGQGIELVGSVDDSKLKDYLVVVPRVGVCSAYWHSASFDQVGAHGVVLVKGADVSYIE
jgi:hypothetical protein